MSVRDTNQSAKRYKTYPSAADYFQCGPRAVERWVREGFIAGYRDTTGTIFVDRDEIEAAFAAGKMRDPRKRYGSKARIVPLPVTREPAAGQVGANRRKALAALTITEGVTSQVEGSGRGRRGTILAVGVRARQPDLTPSVSRLPLGGP